MVRRAAADTAIRPLIFSSCVWNAPARATSTRERGLLAWKVATMGPVAARQASIPRLGASGECTCSTSKPPSRTQRRTRVALTGPIARRATEPLNGTATAPPATTR